MDLDTGRAVVDYREGSLTDTRAITAIQDTVLLPSLRRWLSRLPRTESSDLNR